MKTLRQSLCAAGLILASPLAFGDFLGVYAGGGVWQPDLTGDVGDTGWPAADLEDLGMKDEDGNVYFVALEHPIPVLPNVRLQQTDISSSQTSTISRNFVLDGNIYPISDEVTSDFDASHLDATLYYELLDNWVNLDLGLTFRQFDGHVDVTSALSGPGRQDLDETVPMLYGKAQFDLPLSGFYATAGGNYTAYDDSDIQDLQAGIGYMTDGLLLDLGVEVGLRRFDVQLDNVSDLDADMRLDGTYAQVYLHF